MTTVKMKDADGNVVYFKGTGAGTSGDPFVHDPPANGVTANLSATDNAVLDAVVAALGTLNDAAVITDAQGSMLAFLRGLIKLAIDTTASAVSIADGSAVTLGAKADNKSAATDTTAITAMQVLKEISYMLQNPASQAVTGTFYQATQPTSLASGQVASGAIASGAVASGAIASGAVASGAVVDGAIVTLGAKTDAADTHTDGTAASIVGILKEISAKEQAPASRAVTVASGGIASGGVASGAVASGAVASGAIASGAVASGAVASGAVVDGAIVTLGAKTDDKSTATDTTAVSAISLLKEISAKVQAPASTPVTGTFYQATQPASLASAQVASGAFASGSIASGAVASGAVASGAIASGALASGSVASGAMVDLGAIADAAVDGDAAGTVNAHLRGISKKIAAGVGVTGTFYQATQPTSDAGPSWTTVYGVSGAAVISADMTTAAHVTDSPTGGQKLVITDIIVSVGSVAMTVLFEDHNGTDLIQVYMPANSTLQITPRGKLKLGTADLVMTAKASVAGAISVTAIYYSEA
jgi:uncharacterized protein YjbI with pentapeptide repeats